MGFDVPAILLCASVRAASNRIGMRETQVLAAFP